MSISHQLITGISFGLTSGVITALGVMVGLYSATSSRLAVVAGIVVMAVADGMSDAAGMHISEESETEAGRPKHTAREVWLTTFFTFISVCGFTLTFAVPVLLLPLNLAVWTAVGWGMLLLILLNYFVARAQGDNPLKLIIEHVLLALVVIVLSDGVGRLVSLWVK